MDKQAVPKMHRNNLIIYSILIFSLLLRVYLYVGLVNADPQDDMVYLSIIKELSAGKMKFSVYGNTSSINVSESPLDDVFRTRLGFLLPEAFFSRIIPSNQVSYSIFSLLCSLSLIYLSYLFGKNVIGNEKVGLLAAFLLSIFPLDIVNSTRILPEECLALFISLSIYLLAVADFRKFNLMTAVLSGISFGLAFTVKPWGVILIPVYFLVLAYRFYRIFKIKSELVNISKFILCFVFGFIFIFGLYEYICYSYTGNFLIAPKLNFLAINYNIEHQYYKPVQTNVTGFFSLVTFDGDPFEYTKLVFGVKPTRSGLYYFGLFYFFLTISLIWLMIDTLRNWKKVKDTRERLVPILIWFIIGLVILSCTPFRIVFSPSHVEWWLIQKEARYLSYLSIPLVLIISYSLLNVTRKKALFYVAFLLIAVSSIALAGSTVFRLRDGISELREVSAMMPAINSTLLIDHFGYDIIDFYTDNTYTEKLGRLEYIKNASELNDKYLVVGGARGVDIGGMELLFILPQILKPYLINTNPEWNLVKEIRKSSERYRLYPLKIYYIS